MEDDNTMESGTIKETTQNRQIDGIKYCPDMCNVVLPSFIPVKFKPGFSGRLDQAEQMLISKQQYQVCVICKDGPRCTVTHQTKTGLAMQDGSPCAASTWTAHPEIVVTVPGLQPYSVETACKAHPEGGDIYTECEDSFTNDVTSLIEKWEGKGGEGGRVEEGEGGGQLERRKSSEFILKLNIFENVHEANIPTTFKSGYKTKSPTGQNSGSNISINAHNAKGSERNIFESDNYISRDRMRRHVQWTETKTNGKRVRDGEEMETCGTKKMRPN